MVRHNSDGSLGRGDQVTTRGGVEVITSPDGSSTTITDHGRVTTVTTSPDGHVTVTVNGRPVVDARELNAAIARVASSSTQFGRGTSIRVNGRPLSDREVLAGGVLAGVTVGMLATTVFVVVLRQLSRLGRRATPGSRRADLAPRLDRIEAAVETIALEVERASEAQRYSAKLLTERLPDPVARAPLAGRAEPRVLTPH
jgi:hypothetical protein